MTDLSEKTYFYKNQGLYQKGETIPHGNWGRVITGIGTRHTCFYREYVLEKIRSLEFSDRPSRMKALFVCEDREFAISWVRSQPPELVYEVKPLNPSRALHRGDMSWVDYMNEQKTFIGVEDCARHYWRGDERERKWEIVLESDLIILERLTKIPEDAK